MTAGRKSSYIDGFVLLAQTHFLQETIITVLFQVVE